jgi:hypothetical protein
MLEAVNVVTQPFSPPPSPPPESLPLPGNLIPSLFQVEKAHTRSSSGLPLALVVLLRHVICIAYYTRLDETWALMDDHLRRLAGRGDKKTYSADQGRAVWDMGAKRAWNDRSTALCRCIREDCLGNIVASFSCLHPLSLLNRPYRRRFNE